MTMASLADELNDAKRVVLLPGARIPPAIEFNSLSLCITEFSAFMSEYDKGLMGGLTHLWDSGDYSESRRGNKLKIRIPNAQLNMLAGATPSWLMNFLPEIAWTQGFCSRMIMVYSGEEFYSDIFAEEAMPEAKAAMTTSLIHDLRLISEMYGKMVFLPEAITAFRTWREEGEKPVPDHPKLGQLLLAPNGPFDQTLHGGFGQPRA
jgi:hypothetical protein